MEYVKRLGESINQLYKKIEELEKKLDTVSKEISSIKASAEAEEAETRSLRDSIILKSEFDDFVKQLTQKLSEILPPTQENKEEKPQY